uniref:Uncharacterized protein n=1 Tax=Salix viminalis TaxID=40686 RepID=A0A6N2LFG3_SALVM
MTRGSIDAIALSLIRSSLEHGRLSSGIFLAFSNGLPSPICLFSLIKTKEIDFRLIPNPIRYRQYNLGADFLHTLATCFQLRTTSLISTIFI